MAGKLTALKVRSLTAPGRYGDGDGLWLQVRDATRRSWLFRFTLRGRAREMGLGPLPDVSLAEARQAAQDCRRLLREKVDPLEHRREAEAAAASKVPSLSFREVADRYHAAHEAGWRNARHRAQWKTAMEAHVYPVFGKRAVAAVDTGDVMKALEPIWRTKPQTASRTRGRVEAVLDYAKARGWRTGENPARWRGHLANLLPSHGKIAKVEHHAALAWPEMSIFMHQLHAEPDMAPRGLEFLILTAARTTEVTGARWSEIDLDAAMWTVPADRMKGGREHRVPLSGAALAVLSPLAAVGPDQEGFVFPSPRRGKGLSGRAFAKVLQRLGQSDLTVHGFRSSFRDWAAEVTTYPREVAEAALAHALRDKVEAAYRRSDLFGRRAEMMEDWAKHCVGSE